MTRALTPLILAWALLQATAGSAHEFWIEAQSATAANVRVGQMLVGENLPYLDRIIRSARHFGTTGETVLTGRQGDIPALAVDLTQPGQHLITVETEPAYIVFDDLAEFGDYLAYEGLSPILAQHQTRGLPQIEIAEEYLRYAKSLVQVGPPDATVADVPVGLRLELVALNSPFLPDTRQLRLQLLWEGAPLPDAQIALFHKGTDGKVTRQLLRSDPEGKTTAAATMPGLYVFSAVQMLPATGPGSVVWQSHWASLSFIRVNKVYSE